MSDGQRHDISDSTEAAPRSAAAQELRELALIMRHAERLSPGSKVWLRDRLDDEILEASE